MPLIFAPIGVPLTIIKVQSEGKLKKHLANLGIIPDQQLTLLESSKGNVILLIKNGRLALSKDIASKIYVKTKEGF